MFANVALPIPGLEPLTYRFPAETLVVPGARVLVPLGRRIGVGIVTAVLEPGGGDSSGLFFVDHDALDESACRTFCGGAKFFYSMAAKIGGESPVLGWKGGMRCPCLKG